MPELSEATRAILEIVNTVFEKGLFNPDILTNFYEVLSQIPPDKQPIYLIGQILGQSKQNYDDRYRFEFLEQLKTENLFPHEKLGEIETMEKLVTLLMEHDMQLCGGVRVYAIKAGTCPAQIDGIYLGKASLEDKLKGLELLTKSPKKDEQLAFIKAVSTPLLFSKDPVELAKELATQLNESIPSEIPKDFSECTRWLAKTNIFDNNVDLFNTILNHPELYNLPRCIASLLGTGLLNGPRARENLDRVLACDHISTLTDCLWLLNNKTSLLTYSKAAQENFERLSNHRDISNLFHCLSIMLEKTSLLTSFEAQENFERLSNHRDLNSLFDCLRTMVETNLLIDPRKNEEDEADEQPRLTRKFFSINEKNILQINRIPQKNFEALMAHPKPANLSERLNATISQEDFEELCAQSSVTAGFGRT